ncbi:hypothetical protein ACEPAI_4739 [Sanghuangporus weigelae]
MFAQRLVHAAQLRSSVKSSFCAQLRRNIRTSSQKRALVGPPDPVSNLRPVIYDEVESIPSWRKRKGKGKEGDSVVELGGGENTSSLVKRKQATTSHPYQLDEFSGDPLDYQWRLERSRLDAYNHAFWKDSNTRFETAKQAVLSSLPEDASPETREAALSEFYGKWLQQEHERLRGYSNEWNRRNFGGIMLAARAAISQFRSRIFGNSKSQHSSS